MQQKKRLMIWRGSGVVAPAPTPFVNTFSLDFDGIDESLNCGGNFAFTDQITVSCWVKIDVWGTYDALVVQENASGSFYLRQHQSSLNALNFAIYQSDAAWKSITVNGAAPVSDWFHLVGVADGSYVRMYVDGVSVGTPVTYDGTIRTSTDDLVIGNTAAGGKASNCLIDEVAIWNGTGLSAAQVLSLYNSGSPTDLSSFEVTPVAWYRNGDSTKALYFNSIWQIPNEVKVENWSNLAMDFDGVDDQITCGDLSAYDNGDFSVSIWLYKTTSNDIEYVISNSASSSVAGFDMLLDKYENVYFRRNTRTGDTTTGYQGIGFTINNWHHIVGTYNDSTKTIMLYLDGVWQYTTTGAAGVNTASTDLFIGSRNDSSLFFTGKIDDVSIWDKELSSGEITAIYNSGVPTDLSGESNLVGYWRMGETATFSTNWTIPDDSTNSNNGTTSGMGIDARINNAPDNTSQANSVNMESDSRVESVPS